MCQANTTVGGLEKVSPFGCQKPYANKHRAVLKSEGDDLTVMIFRDTRDVVVSSYHYVHGGGGNVEDFVRDPVHGVLKTVSSQNALWHAFTRLSSHDAKASTLVVFYEDLKEDTAAVARQLGVFLRYSKLSASDIATSVNLTSFSTMQHSEASGEFGAERAKLLNNGININGTTIKNPDRIFGDVKARKGTVGGYKSELNGTTLAFVEDKMTSLLDPWLVTRFMKNGGDSKATGKLSSNSGVLSVPLPEKPLCYSIKGVDFSGVKWLAALVSKLWILNCLSSESSKTKTTEELSYCHANVAAVSDLEHLSPIDGCENPLSSKNGPKIDDDEGELTLVVFRDPLDVLVSSYHKHPGGSRGHLTTFLHDRKYGLPKIISKQNEFVQEIKRHPSSPAQQKENVLVVFFEDMHENTTTLAGKLSKFLKFSSLAEKDLALAVSSTLKVPNAVDKFKRERDSNLIHNNKLNGTLSNSSGISPENLSFIETSMHSSLFPGLVSTYSNSEAALR
jgi:hypothetical protein